MHGYLEEGGELLAEEEVLAEVRELCEDEEVPLEGRVEVLTVAEKVSGRRTHTHTHIHTYTRTQLINYSVVNRTSKINIYIKK